jgi:hypothetical protein
MTVAMGAWLLLLLVFVTMMFVGSGLFLVLFRRMTVFVVRDGLFLRILATLPMALAGRGWLGCLSRLRNDTLGDGFKLPLNIISFPIVGAIEVAFALRRKINVIVFVFVVLAIVFIVIIIFQIILLLILIIIFFFEDRNRMKAGMKGTVSLEIINIFSLDRCLAIGNQSSLLVQLFLLDLTLFLLEIELELL